MANSARYDEPASSGTTIPIAIDPCTVNVTPSIDVPLGKMGFGDYGTFTLVTGTVGLPVEIVGTAVVSGTVAVSNFPGSQAISAASLPLPTGAASSALQSTGNTALGLLALESGGNLATIAGKDFATSALQTSGNTSLASIVTSTAAILTTSDFDTKVGSLTETAPATDTASSGLNGRLQRIAQNITAGNGTDITTPTAMPTGGAGLRGWLSAIWTKLNGTIGVTGTFWQATQPVSGTFFQATQPVSIATAPALVASSAVIGHVIVDTAPTTAVTGTFWQATQPVSIATLPTLASVTTVTTVTTVSAVTSITNPVAVSNTSQKLTYGSSAAFTLTGSSLATDTNLLAGRQSTAVVNTTTRAVDYLISGKTKTGTSPTAGTIEVWAYGSFDDTPTYPDTITGSDGNITLTSTNIKGSGLRLVAILPTDTTTGRSSWMAPTSLLAVFGGILPKNFGLFVVHNTAVNLSSTAGDHVFSYTPVYYQGV